MQKKSMKLKHLSHLGSQRDLEQTSFYRSNEWDNIDARYMKSQDQVKILEAQFARD